MSVRPDDGRPETCGACRHYSDGPWRNRAIGFCRVTRMKVAKMNHAAPAWCGYSEKQSGKEPTNG